MNESLKKEIINQIFNQFGLLTNEEVSDHRSKEGPLASKFLLDQKMTFEIDDKKYENNIWSAEAELDGARIQFIIADLTEELPVENIPSQSAEEEPQSIARSLQPEYSLLIQLDDFPPYAVRISMDPEDSGSIFFKIDERWIEASTLFQAKILVAVESIMDMYIRWQKNTAADGIYKNLIDFLKFESDNDE